MRKLSCHRETVHCTKLIIGYVYIVVKLILGYVCIAVS